MNILLFGPPGSGKGTQSKKIVDEFGFRHVSFGEVLRDHIEKGSELGKAIKNIVAAGQLVSNDLMTEVLEQEIASVKSHHGVIFDGFPRNINQAELLSDAARRHKFAFERLIFLNVDSDVIKERIRRRASTESRPDDHKALERIEIYERETLPVVDFYKNVLKTDMIDASRDVNTVFSDIKKIINS